MNKNRGDNSRAVRLTQIQYFLHKHPAGLTSRELAELCDAEVRTIQRDLLILQADLHIPITKRRNDRYGIIKDYNLPPVSYSLYEALELFLATRLMLHQTDDNNPHVRAALIKLISLLPKSAAVQLRKGVNASKNKPVDLDEVNIFEKTAIAWVTQKRVKIIYHSLKSGDEKEWILNPYFIEMTGVGFSTYVIGYAESGEEKLIYPFKLNRIKEITVLDEDFEIPADLSLEKLLGSSWGIIWGEDTEVKLKFAPGVTRRVKESNWHPSQRIESLPDGGCIMTMQVGSTLEMTPWIRGWGPDVEVISPEGLRQEFVEWAKQWHKMYCLGTTLDKKNHD